MAMAFFRVWWNEHMRTAVDFLSWAGGNFGGFWSKMSTWHFSGTYWSLAVTLKYTPDLETQKWQIDTVAQKNKLPCVSCIARYYCITCYACIARTACIAYILDDDEEYAIRWWCWCCCCCWWWWWWWRVCQKLLSQTNQVWVFQCNLWPKAAANSHKYRSLL